MISLSINPKFRQSGFRYLNLGDRVEYEVGPGEKKGPRCSQSNPDQACCPGENMKLLLKNQKRTGLGRFLKGAYTKHEKRKTSFSLFRGLDTSVIVHWLISRDMK
ncbi:MAG: hypothetical protein Ct9H300mP28_37580 [Pseudomonadota bacterium]|nr:MAG: hypothetical protein Ct9H300mP28_37580 [Pseudomonadota bacterium]